jgi:hypothetical protein
MHGKDTCNPHENQVEALHAMPYVFFNLFLIFINYNSLKLIKLLKYNKIEN